MPIRLPCPPLSEQNGNDGCHCDVYNSFIGADGQSGNMPLGGEEEWKPLYTDGYWFCVPASQANP